MMTDTELLLLSAIIVGFLLIALLLFKLRPNNNAAEAIAAHETALSAAERKTQELTLKLHDREIEFTRLETQIENLDHHLETAKAVEVDLSQKLENATTEKQALKAEIIRLEAGLEEAQKLNAERQRHLEENLRRQKEEQDKLHEKMRLEFQATAQKILNQNSQTLQENSKKDIGQVLGPLKEQLNNFSKLVNDSNKEAAVRNQDLKNELKTMTDTALKLSQEASDLTNSLKGQAKIRGNWGEMVLKNSLELAGLRENHEFVLEEAHRNDDGQLFRPDAIVKMPGGRAIVIDSKLSLIAYNNYVNCEDEAQKESFLADHLEAVRKHIKDLSGKSYQDLAGLHSPDFVVMFVPLESALMLALEKDPQLAEDALQRNIGIASPSTIMMVLRTIEHLWRSERQIENAEEISKRGAALYDKFRGFTEDLTTIRTQLGKAQESVESGFNKLSTGRGNLVSQAEKLRDLGVKVKKPLAITSDDAEPIELPAGEDQKLL